MILTFACDRFSTCFYETIVLLTHLEDIQLRTVAFLVGVDLSNFSGLPGAACSRTHKLQWSRDGCDSEAASSWLIAPCYNPKEVDQGFQKSCEIEHSRNIIMSICNTVDTSKVN